jgi:hypothetical protein
MTFRYLQDAHRLKWGESSEWTCFVKSAEENRGYFNKALAEKSLFSALYGMYTVTLNELKAVLKESAQAKQSDAVNKTSLESTAQDDDFQEVTRRKRHISNETSQTDKKSTKPAQHPQLSRCLLKQC